MDSFTTVGIQMRKQLSNIQMKINSPTCLPVRLQHVLFEHDLRLLRNTDLEYQRQAKKTNIHKNLS